MATPPAKRQRTATNGARALSVTKQALGAGPAPNGEGSYAPASGECTCGGGGGELHSCRACARRPFEEGECIVVQERYTRLHQVKLQAGGTLDTRYGTFSHDALLGGSAGVRWEAARHASRGAQSCAGFMHALRLGPALYGVSASHRTQIVHAHDAAFITASLGVAPGARVCEAGVGSGALTALFAWAAAPHGTVNSYDFHAERAAAARQALPSALPAVVGDADVYADGFKGVKPASADAAFLDLPAPERAVWAAVHALRDDGRLCTFSPCVEQVQRTHEALRASRAFHSLVCVTAPVRTYSTVAATQQTREEAAATEARHRGRVLRPTVKLRSRPFKEMKAHTSYLTFATRVIRGTEAAAPDEEMARGKDSCVLL